MFGSLIVYLGFVIAAIGLVTVVTPIARRGVISRSRGLIVMGTGVLLTAIGLVLPAPESRVSEPRTRLDDFAPVWQFHEHHSIRIEASPARVFEAIKRVTADEIFLFRTLTWIRRGGQPLPESIVNAAGGESLIDIATRSGFVRLVDEAPRELVIGTVVLAPSRSPSAATAALFQSPLPPGFAVALMNFFVAPHGADASWLSTETRVFATDGAARRRFATYWRIIYPGSAFIRRMWLQAVQQRAIDAALP